MRSQMVPTPSRHRKIGGSHIYLTSRVQLQTLAPGLLHSPHNIPKDVQSTPQDTSNKQCRNSCAALATHAVLANFGREVLKGQ